MGRTGARPKPFFTYLTASCRFPRRSRLHGQRNNAPEIIEQWTNLHGTDDHADARIPFERQRPGNALPLTRIPKGKPSIRHHTSWQEYRHVVAVDPGTTGRGRHWGYALDVNLYSSYRALGILGVVGNGVRKSCRSSRNAPFKNIPNPARVAEH